MDHLAPFFPLRNPIKDEDAPQKKRKRSRADGEDTAGSASQPAQILDLSSLPSQETSASPRASTSSFVAAHVAAEGSSLTRPLSSTSNMVVEPAAPHHTTKPRSLPPSTPPSHCRSLSESTLPQISPAHPSATSLPQAVSPDSTPRQALPPPQDQAASSGAATAAAESSSSSSCLPAPSESRCVRWTEEEKGVLRESLKRELATGRDADYTRALTRAVNDFLQAFPDTSRTSSAIRQAARSLAAAQRDSQGVHGGGEGAVVTARSSSPEAAQAQTDHHAARRTSDRHLGGTGAMSGAPRSKGGSHASPASSLPVSKTTSAQLPPQRPHASQPQRNAASSGSGSGSINNASSVGVEPGAGGQRDPVCLPNSTAALAQSAGRALHSNPPTARQQPPVASFSTSFPPREASAAAIATSALSSSSAAKGRVAHDPYVAAFSQAAETSAHQAGAPSAAAPAPASSSAAREGGVAGVYGGAFTGPFVWKEPARPPRVSTRFPTFSGRRGAPAPEPRSAPTSTAASSSHTYSECFSFGSGSWRPAFPTSCAPPISETRITSGSRGAAPALKGPHHHLNKTEETFSTLHVGVMKEGDDGAQFETCPPDHYIAVYTSWCVKITRDPPSSSGIFSVDRIYKPIFVLQSGEALNFWTVQMPDDVKTSVKTVPTKQSVPAKQMAGSSPVGAMDTIFYSAANKLCVVFRVGGGASTQ